MAALAGPGAWQVFFRGWISILAHSQPKWQGNRRFYTGFGRFGGPEVLNSDPNVKQMLVFIRVWSNSGVPRWSFPALLWLARGVAGFFFGLAQKKSCHASARPGWPAERPGRIFFRRAPKNPATVTGFSSPKKILSQPKKNPVTHGSLALATAAGIGCDALGPE